MKDTTRLQELLMYMDALSKAQAAGHKVDFELKEVIMQVRFETGVADYSKEFDKSVKERAESEALTMAGRYLRSLKREGLITFEEESIAKDRLFELSLPEHLRQ